jgi:hypothetical protein
MFLPVQHKPNTVFEYSRMAVEIPDVVTKEMANDLKLFALDSEKSGFHRRGSKTPSVCAASFYTCLVFQHEHPIYEILDRAWQRYCEIRKSNITFIEPYEIKSYVVNDGFGSHNDIYISEDDVLERKINLIVQLSDEDEYDGGDLLIGPFKSNRKFGTGIFFPSDRVHSVTPITRGSRFSLIGHAWGPIQQ